MPDFRCTTSELESEDYQKRLRRAAEAYYCADDWACPVAVSLTMKMAVRPDGFHRVSLTDIEASKCFKHFMAKLNRRLFGKPASRYGRRIKVIPILEWSPWKRLHYHALLDCPFDMRVETFRRAIYLSWYETLWGNEQIDVQLAYNRQGFLKYMMKKQHVPGMVDVLNVYLGKDALRPPVPGITTRNAKQLTAFERLRGVTLRQAGDWLAWNKITQSKHYRGPLN